MMAFARCIAVNSIRLSSNPPRLCYIENIALKVGYAE